MPLFAPENPTQSPRHQRIWAMFEIAHTTVDFSAAAAFVAGSLLFFWESQQTAATWLFLFGSILFAAKPTIRLARELRLATLGKTEDLAKRFGG